MEGAPHARLGVADQAPTPSDPPLFSRYRNHLLPTVQQGLTRSRWARIRVRAACFGPVRPSGMTKSSHAGVPRGIAKDRMTVAVAMAGRIDGIADAAGCRSTDRDGERLLADGAQIVGDADGEGERAGRGGRSRDGVLPLWQLQARRQRPGDHRPGVGLDPTAGEQVAAAVELADRSAGERLGGDRRRLGWEDLDREGLGVGRAGLALDPDRERVGGPGSSPCPRCPRRPDNARAAAGGSSSMSRTR
jgi:hypothetical protein